MELPFRQLKEGADLKELPIPLTYLAYYSVCEEVCPEARTSKRAKVNVLRYPEFCILANLARHPKVELLTDNPDIDGTTFRNMEVELLDIISRYITNRDGLPQHGDILKHFFSGHNRQNNTLLEHEGSNFIWDTETFIPFISSLVLPPKFTFPTPFPLNYWMSNRHVLLFRENGNNRVETKHERLDTFLPLDVLLCSP